MGFRVLCIFIFFTPVFAIGKYKVCGITINSPDEMNTFKKHLPASEFEFVELTSYSQGLQDWEKSHGWFDRACDSGVTCDVLLVSGHFGGEFFSSNSDLRLSTESLEKRSCENNCGGILNQPSEVFLMGCNTLASKEKDHRSPDQYLQVLLDDGIDRDVAERVVQSRYGALGSSYKNRMQRAFESIPHIYGFESVGPAGNTAVPFLEKYFKKIGSYADHIGRIQGNSINNSMEDINQIAQTPANAVLADVMKTTAFTQCSGITPQDPAYGLKSQICSLYDTDKDLSERLAIATAMVKGPQSIELLPTVSSFVTENKDSLEYFTEFADFKKDPVIRKLLDDNLRSLQGSPSTQIDLLGMQAAMGVYNQDQYMAEKKNILRPYLVNIQREGVDLLCSQSTTQQPLELNLEDFGGNIGSNPYVLPTMTCATTKDPRILEAALPNFERKHNDEILAGMLFGASQMPGADTQMQAIARRHLASTRGYVSAAAARVLFAKGKAADKDAAFQKAIANPENAWTIEEALENRSYSLDEPSAQKLFKVALQDGNLSFGALAHTPPNSPLWPQILKEADGNDDRTRNLISGLANGNISNSQVADWTIQYLKNWDQQTTSRNEYGLFDILAHSNLTPGQSEEIFAMLTSAEYENMAGYLRGVLKAQKTSSYSSDQQKLLEGEAQYYDCRSTSNSSSACDFRYE